MESFQHVENVPLHRLTCGECGNIPLENLLRRYSIRASSKSAPRSHPYLRPIENVCSEAKNVHNDKWKIPNQRFKAGLKNNSFHYHSDMEKKSTQITDESYRANNPGPYSGLKNTSPHSNVRAFQGDKTFMLDASSTRCAAELRTTIINASNNNDELCHNSNCDVCQDYNRVQFNLESLIASGTGSGEALNLLQQHCCSHENDELEFECELCGCSFDCCIELISHLSLHPENWPYLCQLCKKRFKTSIDVQRHSCG